MSWSKLILVLMVVALGPVGCGFHPMYGRSETAQAGGVSQLANVRIGVIEDRMGQQMRNALVQRITPTGEPGAARYSLEVSLVHVFDGLGHQKDAKATIGRFSLSANFVLSDSDGRAVMTGRSRSIVSYNYLGPRYASIAGERDAEERAISEVAEDVRRQLATYFSNRSETAR